jgi:hypothetical protein
MLAFRKLFLVLALVTLTAVGLSAANVPALQCVANAGVPPIVRGEGIAELVGDLVLNCTGGYPAMFADQGSSTILGPAAIPQVNVQVFLNTNITSKLYETTYNSSEALLMIDEPRDGEQKICLSNAGVTCAAPAPRPWDPANVYKPYTVITGNTTTYVNNYNIWQGRQSGANSQVWLGVPFDAPGTTFTRILRISNVRANASQLGTSSTLVPTQIVMFVSITGPTSIPINNPQQTVAWIQQGLIFSVRRYNDGSSTSTRTLYQCSSHNGDFYSDPTSYTTGCPSSRLRYEEGFASSFKTRFSGGPLSGENQNVPGSIWNMSESGFFRATGNSLPNGDNGWGVMAGWAGVANQGTRLRAVVNNVPAGVRVFVTLKNAVPTSTNEARLVNVASDGSGAYVEVPKLTTTQTNCDLAPSQDVAEVPIFGGTGTATWEIYATNPLALQLMDFGLVLAWKANTANNLPGLGTITVNGMFAPVSTVTTASAIAPVPRFADTSSAKNSVAIAQCVTNLLFPYVTNQQGFNTGMVISNTTKDPYGSSTEAGTCTLYYYGDTNGGAPPPSQTSGVVPAGDYLAWDLLSGGKFGVTPTPGFQGYIIARCYFRMAHGYAFISDTSMARVANGYLALVLDQSFGTTRISTTSETLGQ